MPTPRTGGCGVVGATSWARRLHALAQRCRPLNCLLEASIERSRWSEQEGFVQLPAIPRDAEQALRKATPLDGRYRVACDQPSAEVLASWFEHMREIMERTR